MDMVQSSNRIINNFPPLNNITPFTRVDGWSFLEVLEGLRYYIVEVLSKEIDGNFELITKQLQEWFEAYTQDFADLKEEWQNLFDQFMLDVVAQLEALNDQAVGNLLANPESLAYQGANKSFVAHDEIYVNVMDHGAIGDGTTDDRTAVMNALEVISQFGGGTLYFPPGKTFTWPGIVALEPRHSNLDVLGYGARIGKIAGATNYAIFSGKSMGARGYGSGVRNVLFEGITFFGDLTINRDACAFAGNHAENITFKKCNFEGMQHNAHIADLGGCRHILFEDCVFAGTSNNKTGNFLRSEAIQLDISAAGAASAPDEPGSWDGLPTVDVTVRGCMFIPLTINGVKYPAPKPIGSHARRENAWYDRIVFDGNTIIDPLFDVTSELPGDIHFVNGRNIKIINNTWELTTPASHIAIGFYSYDRGTAQNANNEAGGTPNEIIQVSPQPYSNILVAGNTFKNFSGALLDRGYIQFKNFFNNFQTVIGENVVVRDNYYQTGTANSGMNAVLIEDTKNFTLSGDHVKGKVRSLQARRCELMSVTGVTTVEPGTQSINLTACKGFTIVSNALVAGGTLPTILIDANSANGSVTGNVLMGKSSNPTLIAGDNVIAVNNVIEV